MAKAKKKPAAKALVKSRKVHAKWMETVVKDAEIAAQVTAHKRKHKQLHKALDELVGDFVYHNPRKLPTRTTVFELMQWSKNQTEQPTGVA